MASVAVILDAAVRPRTLLIKRADLTGDPWSGQVAFPGGKAQPEDRTVRDTAIREALEEVGVDLLRDGEFMGYFDSFRTHTGSMDVIPSLFTLKSEVSVVANAEVSSYKWIDILSLTSPASVTAHRLEFSGETMNMPAYRIDDYVVWGLTHRIISSLLGDAKASG